MSALCAHPCGRVRGEHSRRGALHERGQVRGGHGRGRAGQRGLCRCGQQLRARASQGIVQPCHALPRAVRVTRAPWSLHSGKHARVGHFLFVCCAHTVPRCSCCCLLGNTPMHNKEFAWLCRGTTPEKRHAPPAPSEEQTQGCSAQQRRRALPRASAGRARRGSSAASSGSSAAAASARRPAVQKSSTASSAADLSAPSTNVYH